MVTNYLWMAAWGSFVIVCLMTDELFWDSYRMLDFWALCMLLDICSHFSSKMDTILGALSVSTPLPMYVVIVSGIDELGDTYCCEEVEETYVRYTPACNTYYCT